MCRTVCNEYFFLISLFVIFMLTLAISSFQLDSSSSFNETATDGACKYCSPCQITPATSESTPDIQDSDKPHALELCNLDPEIIQPMVVIIGAGLAGLSAAARLSERGINNYVILEANQRPGGRIHSSWLGDTVVELGAKLEPKKNYSLKKDQPIPASPVVIYPRGLLDNLTSSSLNYASSARAYYIFRQIQKEAHSLYCRGGNKQHGSLLEFMSFRIQQEVQHFPEDCQEDAARIMFESAHMLTARCSGDTNLISKDPIGYYMNMPGGAVRVPLGMHGLISPILKKIHGDIIYGKTVNRILWGVSSLSGPPAAVHTSDGDEFPADFVVVTIPLGTLCNYHSRLFCPSLPASKLNAMRCLCTGHFNKVYCEYARPYYYWHDDILSLDLHEGGDMPERNRSWNCNGLTTIKLVPNSDRVVCFCTTGSDAVNIERLTDRELAERLTTILRKMTGNSCIPYPVKILKSNWSSDPYFHGAFSCDLYNTQGEAQRALSQPVPGPNDPVPPIILFAGEATVPGHTSTLSGARLSGVREAERILRLTSQTYHQYQYSKMYPSNELNSNLSTESCSYSSTFYTKPRNISSHARRDSISRHFEHSFSF